MSYLNVLYKRGFERFAAEAKAAGARGVIVPDLPLEHAAALDRALSAEGLVNVRLVPPNASDERIAALCEQAQGLIYAVARRGVTGAKTQFGDEVAELAQRIRACSALPVAVGFGVKTGADVRALRGHADYAVVGTQSLQKFREGGLAAFKALWSELAAAAR
jgi:tryptophan synthase alpha chain